MNRGARLLLRRTTAFDWRKLVFSLRVALCIGGGVLAAACFSDVTVRPIELMKPNTFALDDKQLYYGEGETGKTGFYLASAVSPSTSWNVTPQ